MVDSNDKEQVTKKITAVKTFPVSFALGKLKENISISVNTPSKLSQEEIINQAFKFHSQGNISEASKYYQLFVNEGYKDYRVFSNYGVLLSKIGKFGGAEKLLLKALEIKPDIAEINFNLSEILRNRNKLDEAEKFNLFAIKFKSDYVEAYFSIFKQYELTNELDKLNKILEKFSNIDCIKNELLLFQARLNFRKKDYETAKKLIDSVSPLWIEKSNNDKEIIFWSFKAFIEDKIGNYDLAYSCFTKSQKDYLYNSLNKDYYIKYINSYKNSISKRKSNANISNHVINHYNLAFLIGFPRSGTTLLDTVLRSHPSIEIIEEKPLITTIETLIQEKLNTRLDDIYNIKENNLMILREKYIELLNNYLSKEATLIVDKMPLHTDSLPLINLLFPNSKIIFTHRHPYDTVLSCFQQLFKPNLAMANLTSLRSSSITYDQVMDAWDIYKNNLPLNCITSKYEHLIEDFNSHTLKILDFLGVGWDENVKNYRETALERGKINTPSSSQVVQPLYNSSIGKWENYKNYFADCRQYLDKWVSYFDY